MNTTKSIRCAVVRHRWQPTPVAGMNERICLDCRSFRFDATIHPDHKARSETVSASGPAAYRSSLTVESAAEGSTAVCLSMVVRGGSTAVVTGKCCPQARLSLGRQRLEGHALAA